MSFRIETKAMKAKIGFFYNIWLTNLPQIVSPESSWTNNYCSVTFFKNCEIHKITTAVFPHIVSAEFFFEFGNPKVSVHNCAETIQGRKLFKGGNYMRKYGLIQNGLKQKCLVWYFRKYSAAKGQKTVTIVSAWLRTKNLTKVSGNLRRILFAFNSSKKLISISALSSKKWSHQENEITLLC